MTKGSIVAVFAGLMLAACGGSNAISSADASAVGSADADGGAAPPNEMRSGTARNLSPIVASSDATQLAADNLAFGVGLYGQLRGQNSGNFVFSQTSISLALAMLYAGAANSTAMQMAAALHFTLPSERLHPAFNALDLALMAQPSSATANGFQLQIASSMWVQVGFSFLPSYLDLLAENYGAGLFVESFASSPETARADINNWVSDQTEQMIPELFGQGTITSSTRLVLANAVYFHGDWSQAFKSGSPNRTFHAPTGDVNVPMMSSDETNATLWSGSGWSAAALGYVGGTTSMILVVPDAGTFDAFEQGMGVDDLAAILAPSQKLMGTVEMPRFKFSTSSLLNDALSALGMIDAFDSSLADFSGMDGVRDLSVGGVVHKAVIAVDESGTTAAAATGVTVGITAVIVPTNLLVVDRPFLFFIRHDPSGAILFQGRVVDPSE